MQENFIYVFEFIQKEMFEPLLLSLDGFEWVSSFLNFLSKLLSALFKYDIDITIENLASLLTTIILIIGFTFIVKTFIYAFCAFFDTGDKNKKKRR